MASQNSANQCCNCQKPTVATIWCSECSNKCYCSTCSENVHQILAFSSHRPVSISKKPPEPILCSIHPDEKLKYWCYDHQTLICRDCLLFDHKDHQYALIDKVTKDISAELEKRLQQTQSSLNEHLDRVIQTRISTGNMNKTTITNTFASLHALIDKHARELKRQIDAIENTNQEKTEVYHTQLETIKKRLTDQGSKLECILLAKSHTPILQTNKTLADNIDQIARDLEAILPPIQIKYDLKGIDQLQVAVADCLTRVWVNERGGLPNIPLNARWAQNGITVAGGHGEGSAFNQLKNPPGLHVDEDQTVFVADMSNHRIVEWKRGDTSGRVVAGGNGKGSRTDQLNYPTDVIVDKETNSLIICDLGNRRVMQWSRRSGTTSGEIIIGDIDCAGLTLDDDRFLYVSDRVKHEVRRYRMGEKTKGVVVAGGNGNGAGLNQLDFPTYVFVDREYSVYVSDKDNHRVMKWVKGATVGIVVAGGRGQGNGLTQLSQSQGVFVDSLGTVYVADIGNNRVMRWHQCAAQGTVVVGGNWWEEVGNQFYYPQGLSFDRQGNLYVVDFGNARVQRFSIETS